MSSLLKIEATLALLKPDLFANPSTFPRIESIILSHSFHIAARTRTTWTPQEARLFYHEHQNKLFFERLISYMTSGPIYALALCKPNAISEWRSVIGATRPAQMRVEGDKECLRARFGLTDTRNSFHGSDSVGSARRELEFVFGRGSYDKILSSMKLE